MSTSPKEPVRPLQMLGKRHESEPEADAIDGEPAVHEHDHDDRRRRAEPSPSRAGVEVDERCVES